MPYFLDGTCVHKGTKDNPGETVKCHDTRAKAVAHLQALYANVEDAVVTKELELAYLKWALDALDMDLNRLSSLGSAVATYREHGEDRWLAVSTAHVWDRQGELFTTKAMDYDIARIYKTNDWPELRGFHVRGFKLGQTDDMRRIGKWAVDQGFWHQTPFAQAFKDIVARNTGRWKVSRGFFTVEAAGQCPQCEAGLSVQLLNYMLGVACPTCKAYYHKPHMLRHLSVLKSRTFDITVTDNPAVRQTAIAAYTIQGAQA